MAPLLAALALTLAAALQPPPAPAPAREGPAPPSRVCHIRVIGDLETAAMGAEVETELQRAPGARFTSVVLELEAERARPDVAWRIAQAVRASEVPVIAFIKPGPGRRAGAGALAIGLCARACHLAPGTAIRHTEPDELRWLAPPGTNWERTGREMSGALWLALKERGADTDLAAIIATPGKPAWAGSADGSLPWTIADAPPESGRWQQIVFDTEAGFERLEIPADAAAALGIARTDTATIAQVIAATCPPPASRATRTIASELPAARERIERAVREAAEAARQAETALDIRARSRGRTPTPALYRQGAREARPHLERAAAALLAAERAGEECPEVLRHPPASPERGTRKVQSPPAAAIAEARKEVDRLAERAREHEAK